MIQENRKNWHTLLLKKVYILQQWIIKPVRLFLPPKWKIIFLKKQFSFFANYSRFSIHIHFYLFPYYDFYNYNKRTNWFTMFLFPANIFSLLKLQYFYMNARQWKMSCNEIRDETIKFWLINWNKDEKKGKKK